MRLISSASVLRIARRTGLGLALCVLVLAFVPLRVQAAPPSGAPETYIVQSGDTLYAIALHYDTTVAVLKKLNGLTSDNIAVGQKLIITAVGTTPASAPAPAPVRSYIVQSGDSLYRIALEFGTTTQALADLNDIANPNLISVGQALAIPNSVTLTKPGLTIDPPTARQGGTLFIKVTRPDLASVTGTFGGASIQFTHGAGYFYTLVGISRCAKLGAANLRLSQVDTQGQTISETATVTIVPTAFQVQAIVLPPGKGDLLDPALVKQESDQLAAIVGQHSPARLWNGVFRQPLFGIVSSTFGVRRSYNGGPVGACGHEGIDFAVDAGTPIYSDARGRVVFAGLTQVRGNMVVVDHGLGVFSAYYHQSQMAVQVGQMVEAGDLIGRVGTTGLSTGNHLHWSLFVHGDYVDPMEWTRRVMP